MINFRPHHLLCNLCFRGEGYSEEFVRNFQQLHDYLLAHPDEKCVEIVIGMDDVCRKCPKNSSGVCASEKEVSAMDRLSSELLSVAVGAVVSLHDVHLLVKRMGMAGFERICCDCSWRLLGICEAELVLAK